MNLKTCLQFMLLIFLTNALTLSGAEVATGQETPIPQLVAVKYKTKESENSKYPGYTIDGYATASQLAAQRSHTPAGEDERNFAVFTGITVIFIVFFLAQMIFKRD
jgi:hypothetical protein